MIIAANWKMNLNLEESIELIDEIKYIKTENEIIIFPANINLNIVAASLNKSDLKLGAQNFYSKEEGAVTGETTLSQLPKQTQYLLVGHSERRNLLGETDKLINEKIKFTTGKNYKIILCIGENLETKNTGKTIEFLLEQLESALKNIDTENIIIAYEPIWAIGSGKTPTGEEVEDIATQITIKYKFPILYGGSVNEKNITEFTDQKHISGVLVGGTSLNAKKFIKICS